jgi:multidrug efflux system membrane fusion protein
MDHASSVSHLGQGDMPTDPPKKRRRWIWAVILLLFGLFFFWVLHQHAVSQDQAGGPGGAGGGGRGRRGAGGPAVPVTIATAAVGSLGVYQDAIGTATPVYFDSITSQATGVIVAVHYSEGQFVHKGDPLIDIDQRPYQATLDQAQGSLERDQSILAEAQMDLKRYQDAWAKNAIPRQTLEDQEKQVDVDQGTVKNDAATVKYDQVQLSYCHITSPINGKVGLRLVDPGNLVTANSTTNVLVTVAQVTPITVIFTLPEDSLPQVLEQFKKSHSLPVQAYDRTQQTLLATGKLTTIDNNIDTTTGTVKLRATFDNSKGMLYPNQFVNTRLLVNTLNNQLLIPSSAIQHNGDVSFVYLIQNNKAAMHTVNPGLSDRGNTAVTGLNPGDVVANSSFEKLQDGSPVFRSKVTLPATSTDATGTSAP